MALVQDLYAASKNNKAFARARLSVGDDPLALYNDAIARWINPRDYRQPMSVAKRIFPHWSVLHARTVGRAGDAAALRVRIFGPDMCRRNAA